MTADALVDEICCQLDGLPVEVLDDLEAELAGGPLGGLAHAWAVPFSVKRPDGTFARGRIAKLLIKQKIGALARSEQGEALAAAMLANPDPLWRMVGEAVEAFRTAPPCSVSPGWGLSCPPGVEECDCPYFIAEDE